MSLPNVTAADQQQINKFARLHQNFVQLKEEINDLVNEVKNINDATDELMLLDDEDAASIPLKIGNSFIHFNSDDINERLEKVRDETQAKVDDKKESHSSIQQEMDKLKGALYAKFGDRINLETDKEE